VRFLAAILTLALTACKAAPPGATGGEQRPDQAASPGASGGERRPDRRTAPVIPGVLAQLARGACYGPCPVYEVTVMKDGTVKYTGKTFVITEGAAEKRLTREQLAELRAVFRRPSER